MERVFNRVPLLLPCLNWQRLFTNEILFHLSCKFVILYLFLIDQSQHSYDDEMSSAITSDESDKTLDDDLLLLDNDLMSFFHVSLSRSHQQTKRITWEIISLGVGANCVVCQGKIWGLFHFWFSNAGFVNQLGHAVAVTHRGGHKGWRRVVYVCANAAAEIGPWRRRRAVDRPLRGRGGRRGANANWVPTVEGTRKHNIIVDRKNAALALSVVSRSILADESRNSILKKEIPRSIR